MPFKRLNPSISLKIGKIFYIRLIDGQADQMRTSLQPNCLPSNEYHGIACRTLASIAGGSAWIMEYHSFHLSQRCLKLAFRHFRGVPANGISGTRFLPSYSLHFVLIAIAQGGERNVATAFSKPSRGGENGEEQGSLRKRGAWRLGKFFGPCFCSGSRQYAQLSSAENVLKFFLS